MDMTSAIWGNLDAAEAYDCFNVNCSVQDPPKWAKCDVELWFSPPMYPEQNLFQNTLSDPICLSNLLVKGFVLSPVQKMGLKPTKKPPVRLFFVAV